VANVPNPISRSVRLRASASAKLSRTPATAGNRKTWTWSGWFKRGALSSRQTIFSVYGGLNNNDWIELRLDATTDILTFSGYSADILVTNQVFRDPSAWYHIVIAMDTTQATSSNRTKIYINGVQVTSFSVAAYPTLNQDTGMNMVAPHRIGDLAFNDLFYFDGYITETNLIDGQALTPSSFGGTNAVTGVWEPRQYTGTYGTNGFYLNFKDNASTAALGLDYSGNNNTWTTNNISLTAGSTYDSMLDVPTQWIAYGTDAASVTRGNYCVINGLNIGGDCTISQANLTVAYGSNTTRSPMQGTIGMTTGKWYFEAICTASSVSPTSNLFVGIANKTMPSELGSYTGANASGWGFNSNGGTIYNNGSSTAYGSSASVNDIVGVAFDADTGKLYFSVNGTFQNSGNPVTGTNPAYTVSADTYYPSIGDGSGASTLTASMNFGQRPFAYTPPAGFLSLCTTNLPSPTVLQGDDYFNPVLYTGNGGTQSITGVGFQPDFVWLKSRSSGSRNNFLFDAVRGTSAALYSNLTTAETTSSGVTAFGSDGFSIGSNGNGNENTQTYVGWNWKASNAAAVSNLAGTITSSVSANTTAGFSIVTYTGTGANATVGHGLGVAPRMVIVKCRNQTRSWPVYHASIGNTGFVQLQATTAALFTPSLWNNTTPTSTVFSLGSDPETNGSGNTYVAYCFAAVPGYSAFGSYTGNGSTDGTFVYTGFRPAYVMIKRTDSTANWLIGDYKRMGYNGGPLESSSSGNNLLQANTSNAETGFDIDYLSNGFKLRNVDSYLNGNGATFIYMAFAENPFKNALAR
jgi:hypothetical protein